MGEGNDTSPDGAAQYRVGVSPAYVVIVRLLVLAPLSRQARNTKCDEGCA